MISIKIDKLRLLSGGMILWIGWSIGLVSWWKMVLIGL